MGGIRGENKMTKIILSENKSALVDSQDYEYLNQWKWYCSQYGYAVRRGARDDFGKRKTYFMHRVVNKTPDNLHTDHKNGDRLDNQRANLRNATQQQNNWNKSTQNIKNPGTSRYKGVSLYKRTGKWCSAIKINGRLSHLGSFDCEFDAAKCYDVHAVKYRGEFAKVNFNGKI